MEHLKRRRNPALWHHINRLLTWLIIVAALLFAALNFYPEWVHRNQLAQQLREEQAKLQSEQLLQKKREREVTLLQTDPGYVEVIARDKLGVMKEGETIFRLDGSRAQPAEPAAPEPKKKK
ncbi:MAG: septum formation initiator family protein [Verrucomicrobiae bacterium]